jgi:pyruvate,water dikinase
MLFDYSIPGALPSNTATVWSQLPLQPLASGPLTPFSFSLLAELASRAWFALYDRLGFDPTPRARLLRCYQSHAYLNLSITARLEAAGPGIEPLALQINQQPYPLASWTKPGFVDGIKTGRVQRKRDDLLVVLAKRMDSVIHNAQGWHRKIQGLHWSQAEVLQVMEEIERVGQEPMMAYLAARHNLEWHYGKLLERMGSQSPGSQESHQKLLLLNGALCDLTELVETDIAARVIALIDVVDNLPALAAWLKAGNYQQWQTTCPSRPVGEALADFLAHYGHRSVGEGEIARPRWAEDPAMLMRSLLACLEYHPRRPTKMPAGHFVQKTLGALDPALRKQGRHLLPKIHELHILQSRALHALAFVWAGTRRWALAAAKEALVDGRLQAVDEVFFFELEEIKQMMTGEWNIRSLDEIRATLAQRQTAYQADQQADPAPLLIGDQEAQPVAHGLPGVAGVASGPLHCWTATQKTGDIGAILGAEMLDSGWALALPLADGFVAAAGSPLDPFVAAAWCWYHPVVVGLGPRYHSLVEGAQTTIDGDRVQVTQGRLPTDEVE